MWKKKKKEEVTKTLNIKAFCGQFKTLEMSFSNTLNLIHSGVDPLFTYSQSSDDTLFALPHTFHIYSMCEFIRQRVNIQPVLPLPLTFICHEITFLMQRQK